MSKSIHFCLYLTDPKLLNRILFHCIFHFISSLLPDSRSIRTPHNTTNTHTPP